MVSLLLGLALAFQPPDSDQGIEPHRVHHTHPEVQAQLHQRPAFVGWRQAHGPWFAQFDEVTGQPLAMWGRGVPMPVHDQGELANALAGLLEQHPALFGTDRGQLALRSANYVDRVDTWYVDFDVLRDGLPLYRGGISARIKHGNLILLRVATGGDAPVEGALQIGEMAAARIAVEQGLAPHARHTDLQIETLLLERSGQHGLTLRKVYQVTTRTDDPPGIWVAFVDGETGQLHSVHNEVRFITGTVYGEHPVRTLDGSPFVTSPMPHLDVFNAGDDTTTADDGSYTLAGNGPVDAVLEGPYVDVINGDGGEGYLSDAGPDLTWTEDDATLAEIASYRFLHDVRLWGLATAPEVGIVHDNLTSIVNLPDVCNAYYDGNVNFFAAGYGCNNTGQIADVNYHEWGHGFHVYSLQAGFFDGSLSEGASDTVSFFLTGDNLIAPFFGTNGFAIRNVAPNQVYPQDYDNSYYAVHSNGLIFGGAMWDLWDLLVDAEGEKAGTEIAQDIFTGLLKGGPDIPASAYEALVADDDDGDLSNGTPHQCVIGEAFGQHGLGTDGIGTSFLAFHEPLETIEPDIDTPLRIETLASAADCLDLGNADATLHYRVDQGSWLSVDAANVTDGIEGTLPAQAMGSFVEYYFDGIDGEGDDFASPASGQAAPYSVFVGDVIEIACFDFEADDGDFTHELLAGEPTDGADDWQWGTPAGQNFDPSSAFSGNNVWANDLGQVINGQPFNGLYQADKTNRLTSPAIETEHYIDVFLQYRRWLQIEDGLYDQGRIYANDEEVWSNWTSSGGTDHHQDNVWMTHAVDLGGRADRGEVELAWELQSDGGLEFGGWTIDDVCVYAPAHVDNRLAVLDLQAEVDDEGYVHLTWTNPDLGPYTELRIVRNDDGFPTSVDDGEVVHTDTSPGLGDTGEATDDNDSLTAGYYAIYTTDGDEWLSWTIEGWNAVATSAEAFEDVEERPETDTDTDDTDDDEDGDGDDDGSRDLDKDESSGSCACTQASATPGTLLFGTLLGLLTVARRRA